MRTALYALEAFIIIYVLLGLLLTLLEPSLVYFPSGTNFDDCSTFPKGEHVTFKGTRFYYKQVSNEVIVMYHGNAGSACDREHLGPVFEKAGYSYLFVEYTGYGGDTVKPSKVHILTDVSHVQEFLTQEGYKDVAVMGESIGNGPAAYHATTGNVQKMIMLTPYDQLIDMAPSFTTIYPLTLLATDNFTPGKWIAQTHIPVLVLTAQNDGVIPLTSTNRLYNLIPGPKKMVMIPSATHNTMYQNPETYTTIINSLESN